MAQNNICYVRVADGYFPVTLNVQSSLGERETIMQFFRDIYVGYGELTSDPETNSFSIDHKKEIPDHLFWSRIDKHPFLDRNPNQTTKIIIP